MKTILVDAVNTLIVKEGDSYVVSPSLHRLLEQFPDRKIIVTNADDAQMVQFGLDTAPYKVFTCKHSPEKTDPAYFRHLIEHFGLAAENCVYFEHNPDAVKSAASIGISAYHFDPTARDLPALAAFLEKHI